MGKRAIGIDVLTAARQRIARVFDDFPRVYVSFSGGKDSTVMLHLVAEEAERRGRRFGLLFIDLEAQYHLTIDFVAEMYDRYAEIADPYWVALPLNLRNAVSQYEPQWMCWDPDRRTDWVREPHPSSIVEESRFPFFRRGMEFEEFAPDFGHWLARDRLTCCLVGIRTDESLNRFRSLSRRKQMFQGLRWTTWIGDFLYNAYPIYDWRTEDLWTYLSRFNKPYNRLYDRMHQAGLTIHQARICQPYGDDQRKGLWLYHIIEPDTWPRLVSRVSGANAGALYAQESGNVTGVRRVDRPAGLTWEQYADLLLESMPPTTAEHYRNKISVFLQWYRARGYPDGIPDEGGIADKASPSWTRIVRCLLRNDYWCKGLSFSVTKTEAYEKYRKIMKHRRTQWGMA